MLMKKIFLFIAIAGSFYSCKKDSLSNKYLEFAGIWEFEQFIGYGPSTVPLPPGNGKIIYIGSDKTFERRSFDTVEVRAKYSLVERKDCRGDDKIVFFKTTEPNSSENVISIENGKLTLGSSNCVADGGVNIYRRK